MKPIMKISQADDLGNNKDGHKVICIASREAYDDIKKIIAEGRIDDYLLETRLLYDKNGDWSLTMSVEVFDEKS